MTTRDQANQEITNQQPAQPQPQDCACGGNGSCNCNTPSYVYAIGQYRPFFSSLGLKNEFTAAASALNVKPDDYYAVFSYTVNAPGNSPLTVKPYAYLAEQACWVLSINDIDTYLMVPQSEISLGSLVAGLNSSNSAATFVVTGKMGPAVAASFCGDLKLSLVITDNIQPLSNSSIALMIRPNDGIEEPSRAINFIASNIDTIAQQLELNSLRLQSLSYQFSPTKNRKLVEVIFGFEKAGVESFYCCGVDVTDQNPFLSYPLRAYVPVN